MKPLIRSLVIASAVGFGSPGRANAHFKLDAPASWANQDSEGLPLKSAPCGQSDPGTPAVATNAVTGLRTGSTVTIKITETIFHPGHYRVALAADQGSLPADPIAHPDVNSPCGTADIMTTPVLPVLADNMLAHTTPFSGPQSFEVTLPAGMTCANCILQVIEFMSDHPLNVPGGCFYHHCAQVAINATGTGTTGGGGEKSGCSSASGASDIGIGCAMLGWLFVRGVRRRCRAGATGG